MRSYPGAHLKQLVKTIQGEDVYHSYTFEIFEKHNDIGGRYVLHGFRDEEGEMFTLRTWTHLEGYLEAYAAKHILPPEKVAEYRAMLKEFTGKGA